MKLDQPATAFWFRSQEISPIEPAEEGLERKFGSLKDAVRFVMEQLTEFEKGRAFIATDGASYDFEKIQEIYASDEFKGL